MIDLTALGLVIVNDFITPQEEQDLLKHISHVSTKQPPPTSRRRGRNRIQRFGSSAPYKSHMVSNTIPSYFNITLDRLVEQKLVASRPESITVNEYCAGQVIEPHIDSKSSGEVITVLSVLSEATMVFAKDNVKERVLLQPRSLVQMKGDLRNLWLHSIEPVQALRYSIVFRCVT